MSYRLINANEIAERFPEANDVNCIYVDLPNGLDNGYYDIRAERTCKREKHGTKMDGSPKLRCSLCGYGIGDKRWNYCPNCGAKVVDE